MSGAVELEAELRAEIERYIARCREMSEGGKHSWWAKLAEILATLRADNERLGRERDADIDALHGTFSKPIAVLQDRVEAAEAERDTLLAQVEKMRSDAATADRLLSALWRYGNLHIVKGVIYPETGSHADTLKAADDYLYQKAISRAALTKEPS